jgi:hypothetical protein
VGQAREARRRKEGRHSPADAADADIAGGLAGTYKVDTVVDTRGRTWCLKDVGLLLLLELPPIDIWP